MFHMEIGRMEHFQCANHFTIVKWEISSDYCWINLNNPTEIKSTLHFLRDIKLEQGEKKKNKCGALGKMRRKYKRQLCMSSLNIVVNVHVCKRNCNGFLLRKWCGICVLFLLNRFSRRTPVSFHVMNEKCVEKHHFHFGMNWLTFQNVKEWAVFLCGWN